MKTVTKAAFQGDVLFVRVDTIPEGLSEQQFKGRAIVAHSETGHNHEVDGDRVRLFQDPADPFTCYLSLDGELAEGLAAKIVHCRPFDTHETIGLPKGNWMVRRQREHSPDGWRMVQD